MNFSIKTEYNILFAVLIVIVSVLIAYLFYRKSNLEKPKKILFASLRFFSVFFALLLLITPVISFINKDNVTPLNVFLIDNSASLNIENRKDELKERSGSLFFNAPKGDASNRYFTFSGSILKEITSPSEISYEGINNFSTNLTSVFTNLGELLGDKNISSVNIISDGIVNSGGNPSFTAAVINAPVNYYLAGDTVQKKDLVIKSVNYNKTSFIESSVPINVELSSFKYDKTLSLSLYEEGILIDTKSISVNSGQNDYTADFTVSSPAQGIKKYKAEISGESDEITPINNSREFFIKYIDNKFKVLVLAGGPSSDFAFLSDEIKRTSNFETVYLTQKNTNEFYEGVLPSLEDFQAIILAGYPTAVSNPSVINSIRESAENNKTALFFIESRNVDYGKLSMLEDALPFKTASPSDIEEETGIKTVSSINEEAFKKPELLSAVNGFPNIFKNRASYLIKPSSETILLSGRSSEPVLVIQKTEGKSSAAFLAHGFYKWRLNPSQKNAGETLNYIITNTIVSIADKDKRKKIFAETSQPVYSKYENVKFTASLNPAFLEGGESVKIKITGGAFHKELDLREKGNINFEGETNIPEEGDYYFTAELYNKGQLIDSDDGRFTIGENNLEYIQTRADRTILASLSNNTGGANLNEMKEDDFIALLSKINAASGKNIQYTGSIPLNINPYYLFIIIILLCGEWFLRKRNNLP